jgi:pre-mRNA-processing factor 6
VPLRAQLFWEWRNEKPQWFDRTVSVAPDLDDTWGWRLKFERQHVMAAQQEDVIVRCQAAPAEPRHGETWQPIAKDDKNGGKSVKEILELVAAALQ